MILLFKTFITDESSFGKFTIYSSGGSFKKSFIAFNFSSIDPTSLRLFLKKYQRFFANYFY